LKEPKVALLVTKPAEVFLPLLSEAKISMRVVTP
jgi:hypothetical protein